MFIKLLEAGKMVGNLTSNKSLMGMHQPNAQSSVMPQRLQGEVTLVIAGAAPIDTTEEAASTLKQLLQSGIAPSKAVAQVVRDFPVKKSAMYQLALETKAELDTEEQP